MAGLTIREKMRAWREDQERNNPDYQAPAAPLTRPQIEALARSYAPDAIETLAEVALNPRTAAVARVTASNSLLDRGYGKPRETVDLNTKIETLSADEARTALAAELQRLGLSEPDDQGASGADQAPGNPGQLA